MKIKILNKSHLQLIAIIAMVIDHTAEFAPSLSIYYGMRFIGRMTIVIMSYFVAEGYYKTNDVNKYIIRMAIFAAVSQVPFYLNSHVLDMPHDILHLLAGMYGSRNVIFTLLIGLCLLAILKSEGNVFLKILAFIAAWRLVLPADWKYFCLLWVLAFGLLYGNKKRQMQAAALIVILRVIVVAMPVISAFVVYYLPSASFSSMFAFVARHINSGRPTYARLYFALAQFGGLMALPILMMYNGKKGNAPRLGFYIFYPAHLLLLFFVKLFVY
ncbi:MAG: hypothetical protein IJH37_02705 [Clostridia bacterium]|nr:hypothetical protein [Clostridia bacterium]